MRAALIILVLIYASNADHTKYTLRCRNRSDKNLTFVPSEDKIEGRYNLEWCTEAEKNVIKWKLTMQYIDSKKKCEKPGYSKLPTTGSDHSHFSLNVSNKSNCTQVCFSTYLDLVYTDTCYYITTNLENEPPHTRGSYYDSYHYIINNYTKELFTRSESYASNSNDDEGHVEFTFYLGHVPASYYTVDIRENETRKWYKSSCTVVRPSKVSCLASVEPGRCYSALLHHDAFWNVALSMFENITNINHKFCVSLPGKASASSSPTGEWPTALATAGLLLSVLTVWCIVRRRHVAAWQKRVRNHWLKSNLTEPTEPSNVEGNILLLYARDCAAFKCAAESLSALVHLATGSRVIDVYSGAATRLWAPAPDEWLRLLLARDDTRVLLLQSPAGALLAADLADTRAGPGLVAPLLGAQVSWRRPHAGDALLALALRQLAAAPPTAPYKKHYVANIGGLGADMAPGVTPLRRYSLPESAACLLRDLAPTLNMAPHLALAPDPEKAPAVVVVHEPDLQRPDLAPLLQHFSQAAQAFTDHVRDHPDYLADELLFK